MARLIQAGSPRHKLYRALLLSRAYRWVFGAVPERFARVATHWLWRWLFVSAEGELHRTGQAVLADLRRFCFAGRTTIFDNDPVVMARREGRREVFMRIVHFLNLDENEVQKLMELDDGIG